MGQNSKSTEENNRGGHLPNMGQVGAAPGSAEPGGWAEPPVAPMGVGFGWTARIDPQMAVEGYYRPFQLSQPSLPAYKRSSSSHFTHTPQASSLSFLSSLV